MVVADGDNKMQDHVLNFIRQTDCDTHWLKDSSIRHLKPILINFQIFATEFNKF